MLSQIATMAAEAGVVCEALLGAALLLLWVAIELIGYGGLLFYIVRRQQWFVVVPPSKPARDVRWGITVRAAGLRRNLEFGIRNQEFVTHSKFLFPNS